MKTQTVSIVSIHPESAKPLGIDLKDILAALAPHLSQWIWCVRNLDWLGDDAEVVCQMCDAAPTGLWMTSRELLAHSRKVYQTIDGEFLAFSNKLEPADIDARETSLVAFPESRAEFAIVVVDGSYFEVYAKDAETVAALRKFANLRAENPESYF